MEFTNEITVNVPRSRFIELFDDPENLKLWQTGLLSFEAVSGTPGEPGATSRLLYKQGRGTMEMVETVTRRELPDAFDGTYDAKGVHNICKNEFHDVDGTATRWVAHNTFEFSGFMKIVGLLFGSMFPKQNLKTMNEFKSFAEAQA
ncbi:SRPBCC family protein [Paeniglutamicibacter sp. NPDC012692]|uniref:SRPBCC family protein n=1 Tax=Paeniglutamicibacter sp. NPDC012692 TaxID=3364388 RepID=UPI0036B01676